MKKPDRKPVEKPVAPGSLVPGANNGLIRHGAAPGTNRGGSGRPRDAFRAKLRHLSAGKGLPFLRKVLDGEVPVRLVGVCPKCKATVPAAEFDQKYLERVQAMVEASVDHRLRANEQALKYGLGTQTEAVTPEEIKAQANRMLGELCAILLDEEHWPVEKVQAVAARMGAAANGRTD